jgi:hypothetical protein
MMPPDEAADLAARTFAAIDAVNGGPAHDGTHAADRERVASDLAGLRDCYRVSFTGDRVGKGHEGHATRYADGLRRTATLYGVTP